MGIYVPGGNNGDLSSQVQHQAAKEAAIIHFIEATTIQIYANLVSKLQGPIPQQFIEAANQAKIAAPYLAEALGMIHIEHKEEK